ncbi:MAG: hypothetical protein R3A80_10420 [Bdellovibrionota bacterium]
MVKKYLLFSLIINALNVVHAEESLATRVLGTWSLKSFLCADGHSLKGDFETVSSKMVLAENAKITEDYTYIQEAKEHLLTSEGEFILRTYKGLPSFDATVIDTVDGLISNSKRVMENHFISISDDNKTLTLTQAQEEALGVDDGPCPRNVPYILTWERVVEAK